LRHLGPRDGRLRALTTELPVQGLEAEELIANLRARRFIPIDERAPELPRTLSAFFERAFASRVEHRFASAKEFAAEFERAVHRGMTTERMPASSGPAPDAAATTVRRARATKGSRWVVLACGLGAVLAVGGFASRRAVRTTPTASQDPPPSTSEIPPAFVAAAAAGAVNTGEGERPVAAPPASGPATSAAAPSPATRDVARSIGPAAPRAKADCAIPYEFDDQGTKRWKRECL
jgi:hypothetical protein